MRASSRERLGRAILVIASVALCTAALEGVARVVRRFRGGGYEADEASRFLAPDVEVR